MIANGAASSPRAGDDLADELERGQSPIPAATPRSSPLHLAIGDAPAVQETGGMADGHEDLPRHHDDYDWHMCSEVFFQDHDVLMLYDDALDGVEDPAGEVNQQGGIGDLRPDTWFAPFDNIQPRDPGRGYRR